MEDDLQLMARVAANEPTAIEDIAASHLPAVYRFLRHLTRREHDAEDLAQQTLLRAIAGARSFDGRASVRTWMLSIGFREYTKWRRRKPWLPLLADFALRSNSYEQLENKEVLLAALQRLPTVLQSVILLHYIEQQSITEISTALNIPEGTVKSRLHNAKSRLRAMLGPEELLYANESI